MRWCAALLLVAAAAAAGHQAAWNGALARLRSAAGHRLDMMATGLDADLARFDYLPALLQMTPVVPALLDAGANKALRDSVNRYLSGVNSAAGADMLYVLDPAGVSLAASDWDQPGTTIDQDLSFRPYVVDALQQGRGRFYGVGITSGKPGYYLSYALRRGPQLQGVVTVKVNIEAAERAWRKLPGGVLLLDERGVVILATRDDLKYRPLAALTDAQRADIARTRPYGAAAFQPLRWTALQALGSDAQTAALDDTTYLASARGLRNAPWRLVVLDDLAPARSAARTGAVTAGLAMAVLLLLAVALWQRRRAIRLKLASQAALQAAHDNLETTVVARTAQLRAAQQELVHAGKMAALGQLSAGMVHELTQPLTAMRTLADSAGILLAHQRHDEVRGNLQRITGMVDRLARLTAQLKTFAHKGDAPAVPAQRLSLARAVAEAQALVGPAARAAGVQMAVDITPPTLAAWADASMLGSVLTNLMRNAIDAMRDMTPQQHGQSSAQTAPTAQAVQTAQKVQTAQPTRLLRIDASAHGSRVRLRVCDSGPGIRADILPRLFEPFVTSKPAGEGLGLGLAISAQLLRSAGGSVQAANGSPSGACFTIDLPLAPAAAPRPDKPDASAATSPAPTGTRSP